ncbi:substrate-binding domain-containing protein [Desulfovibrio ferrophilus]|uniref:ABC-type phosphate transport system, periplasmic component n=1 Tax=Desulfovibrio ferrophilus TaxID=241368 RepID=A0A2Z6AVH0_9BACT|nr:substrate-binding domain-containing protein [Desulfovibrio ferrophilus]BBD07234.1 ABC-type phosphate transport system, periplasmic component [Desulfovibrio ferrophilus]
MRLVILLMVGIIAMCPALGDAETRLVIAGTGDGQEVFEHLAREYQRLHPQVRVLVPPTIDSSGGIRATASGQCDIGRVARPLKEEEKRFGLEFKLLAYIPVVIATHPDVPLRSITPEQIVSVFSGATTDWKQLGAGTGKIYLVQREEGDAVRIVLCKAIKALRHRTLPGYIAYSAEDAVESILMNPGTIGYVSLNVAESVGLNVLSVGEVRPDAETIASGHYPLALPIGFVWRPDVDDRIRRYLDYAYGPEGHTTLRALGVLPAHP